LLTPHWQELAGKMKRTVNIGYWDTEQGANPPAIVGQIQGTPTIKFIVPSKKNKKNQFNKKIVSDYNGARETKPMMSFAILNMPNFVEKVTGQPGLKKYLKKADDYGLPKVLVFSKSSTTSSMIKAISTEYRRRALVGEVKATKNNQAIVKQYSIKAFPKVIVVKADGSVVEFEKKPSFNSLNFFIGKHVLKKPVTGKKQTKDTGKAKKEL
jgi:hypothetical protein